MPQQPPRPAVHVCLVSDQAVPNVIPAIDRGFAPEEVVLVVSPDKRRQADWLAEALRGRVRISRWPLDDAWDVEHISDRLLALLTEREGTDLALNATGGTKPMAIAAYRVFSEFGHPIFYVHPEQDRLVWLHPPGLGARELEDRIKLEPFFRAHGARMRGEPVRHGIRPDLREVGRMLVDSVGQWSRALGRVNYLAGTAERNGLVSAQMEQGWLRDGDFRELLEMLRDNGLVDNDGWRLRFPDEATRFFVNGGWLEDHVFGVLAELRGELPHLQDLARSVEVARETPGGEVPNELDVAALVNNRLHIIECKTRRWQGDEHGPGAEALYKLDSLHDLLGGLKARAMLVSYRDLPDHDRRRAASLGIEVCGAGQLHDLKGRLKVWLG